MSKKLALPSLSTLSTVLDSVELVKKAWSSFNLPTQFAPTMDVDELDKRIADLKAVEQWLNVNLSMLRGTIQGLEIQRGTLAAVQAFSSAVAPNLSAQSSAAAEPTAPSVSASASTLALDPGAALLSNPSGWWSLLQSQFNQVAQAALAGSGLANSLSKAPQPAAQADANKTARKAKAPARVRTGVAAKQAAPRRRRGSGSGTPGAS